ncbi:MAG: hypothetical protein HIU86_08970 [Acidobacteria bacterium]|nr:hypothetical protein [Acidobacteriota bacterium]
MTERDRVVLRVLATGFLAGMLTWRGLGPWAALGVGLVALAVASVVYRVESPRIDLDDPERWERHEAERAPRRDQ